MFAENRESGQAVAEFPDRQTLGVARVFGAVIPVRGVPAEERLVMYQQVLNIADVATEFSLGSVRENLLDFGIRSILIVPVVIHGRTIASFSLDAIQRTCTFSNGDIELCQSLANQVAVAIEKAGIVKEARERADQLTKLNYTLQQTEQRLELLLKASNGIAQSENLSTGLQQLAEMMVALPQHTFCRIPMVDDNGPFLIVKADFPSPRHN